MHSHAHEHEPSDILAHQLLEARGRFLAYIRRQVSDPELAEDILQDGLLRAVRSARSCATRTASSPGSIRSCATPSSTRTVAGTWSGATSLPLVTLSPLWSRMMRLSAYSAAASRR